MSVFRIFFNIYTHRELIRRMIQREIVLRYRGSILGMLWSFFTPLLMLGIYTFVFSVVFQARWSVENALKTDFALILFAGLMIFYLFSDTITRAPGLVQANANYVKKVVFPLEILSIVSLGAALFQFLINFLVWLMFMLIFRGLPPLTIFLLPLLLFPFLLFILGLSWFFSSVGVYVRDIGQLINVFMTVLMFLSPLFYPISALPAQYQVFILANPLTFVIEQSRDLMIWGKPILWQSWGVYLIVSVAIAWLGLMWFVKTKKGFADVI